MLPIEYADTLWVLDGLRGELAPCPLCGSADVLAYSYEHAAGTRYGILCQGCGLSYDPGTVQDPWRAVRHWNSRP